VGAGGGGGEGVCEGGGGGGEESMVGLAGDEGTETMECNRDMKMGIGGEGVGAGGESGQRRLERKGGLVEHNIPGDVNKTRGDIQILINFV